MYKTVKMQRVKGATMEGEDEAQERIAMQRAARISRKPFSACFQVSLTGQKGVGQAKKACINRYPSPSTSCITFHFKVLATGGPWLETYVWRVKTGYRILISRMSLSRDGRASPAGL